MSLPVEWLVSCTISDVGSEIRIGCSGWQYRSWRGPFYPPEIRQTEWFSHYASEFDTVEVNNTFYRLPERSVFVKWRKAAPEGFLYAIKASRYLTHLKRLREPIEPLRLLLGRATALGPHLGPVLYQLPSRQTLNLERLDEFLSALARAPGVARRRTMTEPLRHAVEFRHPSWYVDAVFDRLRAHDVALCVHDREGSPSPRIATASFVYVRFHGTSGAYWGEYDEPALAAWATWLHGQHAGGRGVFAYFNNDPNAMAVRNATMLRRILYHSISATTGR